MLETVPRLKIRDVVLDRLKTYIASEGLEPGDRLPTETALAAKFGVSRLSLREATKALELLGVIESKTGVGLTVGRLDFQRVAAHLAFHSPVHQATPLQLIETRSVIELGALPYTARRLAEDATIYEQLRELAERFRGTNELQEWIDLDIAFHRALLDASGLAPLVAFGDLLQIFFLKFRESVKKGEWRHGIESHLRILAALRDQDVTEASGELRRHIESHKKRMGLMG